MVDQKTQIESIDGTPVKRVFLSIISDYDFKTGLCELVDNAIDLWMSGSRRLPLTVTLELDVERQLISVRDNAGGVGREELRLLVAPGESKNNPDAEVIGIFGVGGKRAGIALAENLVIKTRLGNEASFELNITQEWLETENWLLPAYEIPDIDPGTTRVELSHLRRSFKQADIEELFIHFGETYDWFLRQGCSIELNGEQVAPKHFEEWAFPPDHSPRRCCFDVDLQKDGKMSAEITAGLIQDRDPDSDNYGVYFYCNHRLIAKDIKNRYVGYYAAGEAGVPHADASLCRIIVRLQGPAHPMPWNSSKNSINFGHPVFQQISPVLLSLIKHFSSLSRRLKDDWQHNVFQHDVGTVEDIPTADVVAGKRLNLPALPRIQKPRAEQLKSRNKVQIENQPWTLGLVEAMAMIDVIEQKRLETKNRISLILLDSNFEIALKEFIVNRKDLFPPREFDDTALRQLFSNRRRVIEAVAKKIRIPDSIITAASHYYELRNKLIHERATATVLDRDIKNYRVNVERLLKLLFDLDFP